jgi:hypothetical protein
MGEIQILPNADCMLATADMGVNSSQWKAILADGSLVAPGTAETLKLDYVSSKWVISTTITSQVNNSRSAPFENTTAANDVTVPQILKELAIFPAETGYSGDRFYANNGLAECFPFQGGNWLISANAGVFMLNLADSRSLSGVGLGVRSVFYELIGDA